MWPIEVDNIGRDESTHKIIVEDKYKLWMVTKNVKVLERKGQKTG